MTEVQGGDPVTYYDVEGLGNLGYVVEPLPEDDYITVAHANGQDPRRDYVGTSWKIETSVVPHPDHVDGQTSAETHSYKPGWPDQEETDE